MFNELMNGWMERLTIVVVMFVLSSVGSRVKKKKAVYQYCDIILLQMSPDLEAIWA